MVTLCRGAFDDVRHDAEIKGIVLGDKNDYGMGKNVPMNKRHFGMNSQRVEERQRDWRNGSRISNTTGSARSTRTTRPGTRSTSPLFLRI